MITHELMQAIIQERLLEAAKLHREHEALAQRRAGRPRSGPSGRRASAWWTNLLPPRSGAVDPGPSRSSL